MGKKTKIAILIGIITLGGILLLSSYAFIRKYLPQHTNVGFSVSGLDAYIIYNKGTDVVTGTLDPVASYDLTGMSTEITLYKNTSKQIYGHIYLDINDITQELMAEPALKWTITSNNQILNQGDFSGTIEGSSIPLKLNIPLSTTETKYQIYIWLDNNMSINREIEGQTLSTTVRAEATIGTGFASPNPPRLATNMIPVTYAGDETNPKWVVADTSNSDTEYNWYNYSAKKWANAVTLAESAVVSNLKEVKDVNIENSTVSRDSYSSSNKDKHSTDSQSTFTFTTGSSGGTFSFDYSVSSESNYDKFSVTLNGSTIINAISGTQSNTYTKTLSANTTYTMVAKYAKDSSVSSNDDKATITNIVLPSNLASGLQVTSNDDYPWTTTPNITYLLDGLTYNNYSLDSDNGEYTLLNKNSSGVFIDKYICSDLASTSCEEMYKIKEISGDIITKVEVYDIVETPVRENYINAEPGTEIPEEAILAYYVWIPRYKYKVWNINKTMGVDSYNAKTTGIDIVFESGTNSTGTVDCKTTPYSFTSPVANTTNETCTGSNGKYYTHPAFTFGNEEQTGFWVGKYEMSPPENSSCYSNASSSNCNVTNINPRIKPNKKSWYYQDITTASTVIQNMKNSSNIYGFSTDADTYLLKNMDWGAVAYLTNSKYGRCTNGTCSEIGLNSYSGYNTGCGPQSIGSTSTSSTCNAYNTTIGQDASTTGNVYGVYDMSGGAAEFVMGNMSSAAGSYTYYKSSGGSNFTYSDQTSKYIDTYAYATVNNTQVAYNRSRLGDATGEVTSSSEYSWYSDYARFPYSSNSWTYRGGNYSSSSNAGLFNLNYGNGTYSSSVSSRPALRVSRSS